jgi:hypothetical protein
VLPCFCASTGFPLEAGFHHQAVYGWRLTTPPEPDIEDIARRSYRGEDDLWPRGCRGRHLYSVVMRQRSVAWDKDEDAGVEFVEVSLAADALSATGVAIGGEPVAYRLDYTLETGQGFVTTRLHVTACGEGWRRTLDLCRGGSGDWTASVTAEGHAPESLDMPGGGSGRSSDEASESDRAGGPGDRAAGSGGPDGRLQRLAGSLDCDLGLSPITNSMPVLRHRLLEDEASVDLLMAWVSVPDLGVHPSRQRYTALRDLPDGNRLIRFESLDSTFMAELIFDRDGLVVDYPGIGRRLG